MQNKYRLIFSARARRDYFSTLLWLLENRSQYAAINWHNQFWEKLEKIKINPESFPASPEIQRLSQSLREFHFGTANRSTYRTVFSIKDQTINLLAIRHHAQDELRENDI